MTANAAGTFEYTPPAGTVLNVGPAQTLSVLFTPSDLTNYTTATQTVSINVVFDFTGFFAPVYNLPTLNGVKAGSAVPLKFSLAGNQGLAVLAAGFPASAVTACDSTAPVDVVEETVTAGSSSLSYDASTDRYIYVWKTDKAWAATCRQLVIKLIDGTSHRANFKLTK